MMKDRITTEVDERQKENLNLPKTVSGKTDRRENLDEDARHMIEGLNRRKTEERR